MAYLPGGHSPSAGRMRPQTMESPQSESNGTFGGVKPLEFKAAMRDFGIMFPTLDSETIETVLRANNGAVDATIDQLLEMCDNLGGGSQNQVSVRSGQRRDQSNLRPSNSPATLAIDNVDSYNLTLASLTPPKNSAGVDMTSSPDDTNMYANLPFQDNVTTSPRRSEARGQPAPEVSKSSYKYQTAMFKFKNPFMGPLADDFLRIKSDASFDQAVQYSRQKRKQVENIRNEKSNQNFYSTNGAHADSEFDNIVTPVSGDPPVQSAWGAADVGACGDFVSPSNPVGTVGGLQQHNTQDTRMNNSNTAASHLSTYNALFPNPSPSSGAIPKNYNARSWSGTARSTISTFGKKLSLKKNNDNSSNVHSTSTLPATGSHGSLPHGTNLTRSRGYTPSTMNLLGDCDDDEEDDQILLENGGRDADDEMISLQSSRFPPSGGRGTHLGSSRVEELSEDSEAEVDYNPSPTAGGFHSPQSSNPKSSRSLFTHEKRLAPNRQVIN